jgi:flagellar biosynthesis chaperone FliJ
MQYQKQYQQRVQELEAEGMTRSDAQAVADAEFIQQYGLGWEFSK